MTALKEVVFPFDSKVDYESEREREREKERNTHTHDGGLPFWKGD